MTLTSPPAELDLAREKEAALVVALREAGRVLIGFSGGVDSAYLACVAVDALGPSDVLAVIGISASYPAEQWATARAVAEQVGLSVVEVRTDELADPSYAANPVNRCYFCKTELWSRLRPIAGEHGFKIMVDGTNADDVAEYRPGAAAAREHGVRSPLADAGLTKREIRVLSRARGLPTWAQPSSPCLSSRIPYGTPVTTSRLEQIETAERALRSLGIAGDLRVRHHGDIARVELARDELSRWIDAGQLGELTRAVQSAGFARAALDLRGFRSGSLNILEGIVAA